jgi:protoheme IX farnesyltransferase
MNSPLKDTQAIVSGSARGADAVTAELGSRDLGHSDVLARVRDYFTLTKPEITFLVTISSLAGFLLASPDAVDGWRLFWAMVGIPLVSSGGAALNHYYERRHDAVMRRTASRPLPAGRIAPERAGMLGFLLTAAGLGILCPLTNPLTGVLAAVTVALYVYVYTPLKRITPFNTLVGTLPGALPALGGWTAATGHIGAGGLAVFAILACWQMPHFLALAWMYRKDYQRAGFRMWTVDDAAGVRTAVLTTAFTGLTLIAALVPALLGIAGTAYVVGSTVLGVYFMRPVLQFARLRSHQHARRVLKASIVYIPALVFLILLDRLV